MASLWMCPRAVESLVLPSPETWHGRHPQVPQYMESIEHFDGCLGKAEIGSWKDDDLCSVWKNKAAYWMVSPNVIRKIGF